MSPKDMGARELHDAADHISQAAVDGSATQVVPAGSVLIVVRSGILIHHFPVSLARIPVALNQDLKALLPGGPLLPDYLAYALEARSDHVLRHCVKRGATVHSVDIGKLQQLSVGVPPPSEQRRIVEILDQADRLRRLRAEADAKADRILPALFIKMFGDPATNPRTWSTVHFASALVEKPRNGLSPSSGGTVPARVLTLTAITGGFFDEQALKDAHFAVKPKPGNFVDNQDLLICRGNGNLKLVGRSRFPRRSMPETIFPDTIIAARVDLEVLDREYLECLWQSPFLRSQIESRAQTTSGIHKINQQAIEALQIRVPPIELQRRFGRQAKILFEIPRHQSATDLERVFKNLLRRAFDRALTASWRESHMKELLQEMEQQAKALSEANHEGVGA